MAIFVTGENRYLPWLCSFCICLPCSRPFFACSSILFISCRARLLFAVAVIGYKFGPHEVIMCQLTVPTGKILALLHVVKHAVLVALVVIIVRLVRQCRSLHAAVVLFSCPDRTEYRPTPITSYDLLLGAFHEITVKSTLSISGGRSGCADAVFTVKSSIDIKDNIFFIHKSGHSLIYKYMYILIQYKKGNFQPFISTAALPTFPSIGGLSLATRILRRFICGKSFFNRNEYPVCYILYQTRTYLHFRLHYAVHRRIIHVPEISSFSAA